MLFEIINQAIMTLTIQVTADVVTNGSHYTSAEFKYLNAKMLHSKGVVKTPGVCH